MEMLQNDSVLGEDIVSSSLNAFSQWYEPFHYPLVVIICVLGILCNIIMIAVLWRMLNAINILLLSLSFAQLLLLVNFLYASCYTILADFKCYMFLWNWNWTFLQLMTVNMNLVSHIIAVFHFVCISLIRFLTVTVFHRRQSGWLSNRTAMWLCIGIYALVLILCTPFYFNSELRQVDVASMPHLGCAHQLNASLEKQEVWIIRYSERARNSVLLPLNYWLFGILCKLVPCLTILIFTLGIAYQLNKFQQKADALRQRCDTSSSRGSRGSPLGRTNRMILIVLVLFLVVELPQGIINLLMGVVETPTVRLTYETFSDPFDLLTVFYSSVNFAIFCGMSSQFRKVFSEMLASRRWRWAPVPAEPSHYPLSRHPQSEAPADV